MIVKMRKISFVGMESQKENFLQRLQQIGVAHLIFPKEPIEAQDLAKELARIAESRKFLASKAPSRTKNSKGDAANETLAEIIASPVTIGASTDHGTTADMNVTRTSMISPPGPERSPSRESPQEYLTASEICDRREALAQREAPLQAEVMALKKEIVLLEPWGDFSVEELEALQAKGLHVAFFRVTQRVFDQLSLENVYHQVISRRKGEIFFIALSLEPVSLNIPEERIPSKSLSRLREELVSKNEELKGIEKEYSGLASNRETLIRSETELTNLLAHRRAALNTESELEGRLFILQCWSPLPEKELTEKIGTSFTFYHYSEEPTDDDVVPVAMFNKPAFDSGEDLVKVYSYPSYKDFDPSGFVLYCFAVFFGMIIGDAGYGFTLLVITFLLQRKFKSSSPFAVRFFRLNYFLSLSTVIFGVLGAGYFGISISPENPLSKVMLLDFSTKEGQNQVMLLSIIFGMIHISMALLVKFKNVRDFAALGWVPVIWGGYFMISSRMGKGVVNTPAEIVFFLGLLTVFLFSSSRKNILLRILEGLNGLLGIVQIFADILSYLRLFALGIATMYMAQTFNMLAGSLVQSVPWIGYVFALLILLVGHSINLVLGVMGGIIHGLRLNFLEWYRWCFVGDGLVYKPFRIIKTRE